MTLRLVVRNDLECYQTVENVSIRSNRIRMHAKTSTNNVLGNIPAVPRYGLYISQLLLYFKACHDFLLLIEKLLNQVVKLNSSLRKLYCRHHVLINRYDISVSQMR